MNATDWIARVVVAVAAAFLVRHLLRAWRAASQGECSGCDSACGRPRPTGVRAAPQPTPLLTLERRPSRRVERP